MENLPEKMLPCEDCGTPNPMSHQYCHACGNYLQDDALKTNLLPKEYKFAVQNLEQRLKPAHIRQSENRRLLVIGLAYLSITGSYLLIKMLPTWGGIEYIYLTLRFAEIALPMFLAALISNKMYRRITFTYALMLLALLLWQTFGK